MDTDIATASKYLNNLLAARGLLKGGHKIQFDNPTEDPITPTRILNLVHDLVRRRDRDGEQKETLAMGMKALKESEAKAQTAADRYKARCEELERRCATLQGQERVLNANVRSAEITAKALKDEAARLKVMVQQVRTQCANDIRKRDHQISKLKERLLEKTRGGRGNKQPMAFPGVTVSRSTSTSHLGGSVSSNEVALAVGTDPTLTDDTTAFLTTLSQGLADENDILVSMIKSTITTLKAISGMDTDIDQEAEMEEGDRNVIANDVSHSALSGQVDEVLEHLKDMLNQPNYVPVEDLDVRDREIERLKGQLQGTLEAWKNAIALVDLVNKKPDQSNSKQVKALESVVDRERQKVLEEIDINTRTQLLPKEEEVDEAAHVDGFEETERWEEQEGGVLSRNKSGNLKSYKNDPNYDVESGGEVTFEAENVEYMEPEEGDYYEEEVGPEEFAQEDDLTGVEGHEAEDFEDQQEEESVDLIPAVTGGDDDDDEEEADESSMEIMSPIKPSVYSKKRSLMDPIVDSPQIPKRGRFIDLAPRRRGKA